MLTPAAQQVVWAALSKRLQGGRMEVGQGRSVASAPLASIEVTSAGLSVTASFGAELANTDWRLERLYSKSGELLYDKAVDLGRKAAGAVWTHTITLSWANAA